MCFLRKLAVSFTPHLAEPATNVLETWTVVLGSNVGNLIQ